MGEKRFEVVHEERNFLGFATFILRDTVTGVAYLYTVLNGTAGLTPLLGADGKPMLWDEEEMD